MLSARGFTVLILFPGLSEQGCGPGNRNQQDGDSFERKALVVFWKREMLSGDLNETTFCSVKL
jgi:hypothetical protein